MTELLVREGGRLVELIVLPAVRTLTADTGCVVLPHDQSGLTEPLVPGDEVVLLDVDGEFHAGVIDALTARDLRLVYHIRQGVRLPADAAHDRLANRPARPVSGVTDQSLLDLLGELRDPD